ncbi:MAG: ATP-binding protein [Candidatus Omnitrophica bacterium]|nr:ATP-binding protein [Candidatus Omnitrophota bacterium]
MHIFETIPSQVAPINGFVSSILEKLSPLALDQSTIFNIKLVLYEAIVNAVKHGNKMDPRLSVQVEITSDENQLTIQVTDQGKGFDYQKIPDPVKTENLEKLSGRGIFLIKNVMDKLEFANEGRTIKMTKFLKQ